MFRKLYIIFLLMAGCILYALHEQVPDTVSYNFNIRPILSDKCFKCHGPDASHREADLRLDIPEIAYAALKDNPMPMRWFPAIHRSRKFTAVSQQRHRRANAAGIIKP
jgi:hypothetical protein